MALDERLRLPLFDEIQVASPCSVDWESMVGDHQVRFCGKCEKNVYNLSTMSRARAEALIREKEGNLCVRFYRRSDGTVLTDDCPVGVRKRRRRRRLLVAAGTVGLAAAAGGVAASVAAFWSMGSPRVEVAPTATMGEVTPQPARDKPEAIPIQGGPLIMGRIKTKR